MDERSGDVFFWAGKEYPIETATDAQLDEAMQWNAHMGHGEVYDDMFNACMREKTRRSIEPKFFTMEEFQADAEREIHARVEAILGPRPQSFMERVVGWWQRGRA